MTSLNIPKVKICAGEINCWYNAKGIKRITGVPVDIPPRTFRGEKLRILGRLFLLKNVGAVFGAAKTGIKG